MEACCRLLRAAARLALRSKPRICDRKKGNTLTIELGGAGRLRIKMSMARSSRRASLPGRTFWLCSLEKSAEHQPPHRQSDQYARGHDLSLSALANQVGACAAARNPLPADRGECALPLITCITTLGKGKTDPDRQNVRDDRQFGGTWPPALYRASRGRREQRPERYSSVNIAR